MGGRVPAYLAVVGVAVFALGLVAASAQGVPGWLLVAFGAMLSIALLTFPGGERPVQNFIALALYVPVFSVFWIRSFESFHPTHAIQAAVVCGACSSAVGSAILLLRQENVRRAVPWLLAATFCGLLISFFSGSRGGADPMVQFIQQVLGLTTETAESVVTATRKVLHFLFYGLLARFAAIGAFRAGASLRQAATFAILWGCSHAVFDETRQFFSPGRTGSPWDVLLDVAGMIVLTASFFAEPKSDPHTR